ncbi:MAG TPA: IclR family transcriptional regulator [Syntrophorhabdaceae bacterium]|nr:IclR family transcriptional regulator [Syntrophorhabdaceae bacterium]
MATDDLRYKTLKDFGRILSIFESDQGEERSVSDIARLLEMLPSKVSRMMKTLQSEGLFERNPESGRYRTGGRFLQVGLLYVLNHPLRRIILPHVEQINKDFGLLTSWGIFRNLRVIVVDRLGPGEGHYMHPLGSGPPLHSSSYGKIFLAYQPPEEQERILRSMNFQKLTAATITDVKSIKQELARIRKRGYAFDDGGTQEGLVCLTTPVLNDSGDVAAALTIGGRQPNLMKSRLSKLAPCLAEKTLFISRQLGYTSER